MGHWDDVSTVRAALRHGRGKRVADAFRAEAHGAIFLALDPSERTQLVGSSSAAAHRAHELARALVREGRLEPALGVYEVVVAALPYSFDALALLEALALAARIEGLEPARLRGLIDLGLPRIASWVDLTRDVAVAALRLGDRSVALDAVRAGVLAGLDPSELANDAALASLASDRDFVEALAALWPPADAADGDDLAALSAQWNEAGRAHFVEQHPRLVAIYDRGEEQAIDRDPRAQELADRVIDAARSLRDAPGRARELFDPAEAPLAHRFAVHDGMPIGFTTILGPDDLLVRAGPSYRSARMLRLRGGRAELVPSVVAAAANRAHTRIALASPAVGIEVREVIDGPTLDVFAWPDLDALLSGEHRSKDPLHLEHMVLSGDGTRLLVVGYRQGVLLGSLRPDEPAWRYVGGAGDDMLHGDLSDDGAWLVHGGQSSLHELLAIEGDGSLAPHASIGPRGEYPHFARFTDDGRGVAINACHFYAGATGYFETSAPRGLRSEHYEATPHLRLIDEALRVYAGAWLPEQITGWLGVDGAFALVGAGMLRVVSRDGALLAAQSIGTSGASADYHPELGLLAVGTYAGQVHVFDARRGGEVGTQDGWTRGGKSAGLREVRRWLLWKDLPGGPVAW